MNMEVQSYIWVLEPDAVRRLGFFSVVGEDDIRGPSNVVFYEPGSVKKIILALLCLNRVTNSKCRIIEKGFKTKDSVKSSFFYFASTFLHLEPWSPWKQNNP